MTIYGEGLKALNKLDHMRLAGDFNKLRLSVKKDWNPPIHISI